MSIVSQCCEIDLVVMLDKVHIVLIVLLAVGDGANILSVLPSSSKSHFIYPNALLLELAASGHKVIKYHAIGL